MASPPSRSPPEAPERARPTASASASPTGRPATKASYAQTIQAEINNLPRETQRVIYARAGAAYERIATMLPIEWVEEETYNALTNAVRGALGDPGTRQFFRHIGRRFMKNPSVQSAVEGVMRAFGISPHSLLKIAVRARGSVVKNAGELTYVYVDKRCARLELRGFPSSTYRHGTTSELLAGTWLGMLDAAGQPHGQVELRGVSLERGDTDFVVTW
ncbi:MAG: hypothetical protein U1A78_03735 [Polyangia bacterium]